MPRHTHPVVEPKKRRHNRHIVPGTCPAGGKPGFTTYGAANKVVRRGGGGGGVYWCTACGAWSYTRYTQAEWNALSAKRLLLAEQFHRGRAAALRRRAADTRKDVA
jgi:hypothetical protein